MIGSGGLNLADNWEPDFVRSGPNEMKCKTTGCRCQRFGSNFCIVSQGGGNWYSSFRKLNCWSSPIKVILSCKVAAPQLLWRQRSLFRGRSSTAKDQLANCHWGHRRLSLAESPAGPSLHVGSDVITLLWTSWSLLSILHIKPSKWL